MTSRIAGRINAASASPDEEQDLLKKRKDLLDKKYSGAWTAEDANRLQYVRWSLDRIEDARSGPILDAIEDWVVRYERFQSEIQDLQSQLAGLKGKRR